MPRRMWVPGPLRPSVCQLRHDPMEQGPTEPHAGRSAFLPSSGGAGGAGITEWPLARHAATSTGQTPMHHPKMHPPKQPIQPQKGVVTSTGPVFLGLFEWFLIDPTGFWVVFVLFLEAS